MSDDTENSEAVPHDPAFTAIDRHKLARGAFWACRLREPALTAPEYREEVHEGLGDASRDAYRAMLGTPPTTDDGAAALIRAFLEYEGEQTNDIECAAPLLKSLLAYLEK